MRKKTKEEFIQDAIKVHGDKYDYKLVEYNGTHTKVKIICGCDNHGIFEQSPHSHISGAAGCPVCFGTPKKTTEQFITDAIKVHGDKYKYDLVEYIDNKTKVKIICDLHGIFEQTPSGHLRGDGCGICAIEESSLRSTFVDRANGVHNLKYNYELTEYVNNRTDIKIICPQHKEIFELRPDAHLEGRGCPYCSGYKLHKIDFVIAANKVHNYKYDYSLFEYVNQDTKIKIICPSGHTFEQNADNHLRGDGCGVCAGYHKTNESVKADFVSVHGDKYDYSLFGYVRNNIKSKIYCKTCDYYFEQNYSNHMRGDGCPKCVGRHKSNEDIINEFTGIHGDIYDYSRVNYTRSIDKVSIGCKKHNIIFEQTPSLHLCGHGCPDCGKEKVKIGKEEFIRRSIEVHGDKYNYSKVEYINSYTHVIIICPEHGEFKQTPKSHSKEGCGCPTCSESIGEREIRLFLDKHNIIYEREKMFDGCINKTFLKYDYYLIDLNFCVEFDGKQHYEPIEYFGGVDKLKETQLCDKIKNEYCKNNNIRLLRIRYDENVEDKLNEFLFSHDEK